MRNDTIIDELRQARPVAPSELGPPLEVCEQILAAAPSEVATPGRVRRPLGAPRRPKLRRTLLGWSARTFALVAGTLTLAGAATAATLIATSAPTPKDAPEVAGPVGFVAYWQHGELTRVTDCATSRDAVECQGERATTLRIQDDTMQAISSGKDKGASVLFLAADGGQIACAGAHACSYMAGQPNAGKPLPRIAASE